MSCKLLQTHECMDIGVPKLNELWDSCVEHVQHVQIHLSSLIHGQVQSHNNRHILPLVNLNCSHLTLQIYTAAVSPLPRPP